MLYFFRVNFFCTLLLWINTIPSRVKWIVFVIELKLLLLCFQLFGIVYLPTNDPVRRPPPYKICPYMAMVQFSTKTRCPPPFSYLGILYYLSIPTGIPGGREGRLGCGRKMASQEWADPASRLSGRRRGVRSAQPTSQPGSGMYLLPVPRGIPEIFFKYFVLCFLVHLVQLQYRGLGLAGKGSLAGLELTSFCSCSMQATFFLHGNLTTSVGPS